ncbi:MAG: alpha/beta hydrolase [Propionibacteriaceae bacterium]|nr:alpha/beta hydrolase [Propionibacteriaceae bacterium]
METLRLLLEPDVEVIAYRSGVASATAPVVVLLHGIGMTHRTFEELQPLLAAHHCVISFDLSGFGATRKPGRPFTVADHAEAVDQALQRLGVGRRVLVGHSMGAQFAVEQAIRRPDDVDGIVLIGPVVDTRRRNLPAQARDLALDTFREPLRANARVLTDYLRGGLGWYLVTLKAMFDYDTEARIRLTSCPVLVVRGEHDPVAREPWCRRLSSAARDGALLTVAGHAHVVPFTAAEKIHKVVVRFTREEE